MAVTTEPPWVNIASGTAARNGTTSHTINFGFTSTSGSLLVAIIHGAVTNTASGWTKQAGPIATGECSLFTKTSTGESSITVTHNGSDYPVNYVIYEFAAGSTVTGADSTTGSNDTMEGLSGLPGTEQVIIGALGRVTVGGETGGSISPSAPWVEDGDLYAAASGTDGSYLAVVHQLNVTATSITPTISPTYSGTWSNGAREKISAAFDVIPPAVAFTKDYVIRWNVLNTFQKDYTIVWNVLNTFTKDYPITWNVLNTFTKDYVLTWNVLNTFTKDYVIRWDVESGTTFQKDYPITWNVLNSFTKDYSITWNVLNSFTKDYVIVWDISGGFFKDYPIVWNIRNTFQKDYIVRWNILALGDPIWTFWNGVVEVSVILEGVWDGAVVQPATIEVT